MSRVYDPLAGSSETPLMRAGLEMLAVKHGESVLKIGCGTGKGLAELCNRVGFSGQVHGIDLSAGMVRQAEATMVKSGLSKPARLVEGDGTRLPSQNASFSAVFLSFTLELLDTLEIPLVLAECRRVLKAGGSLGAVSMLKTSQSNLIVRLYEWFHTHLPTYVDCRPIEAHTMILAAGFKLVSFDASSMWGLPVELTLAKKP
jgi:demethylmenaquinone methyltransferase/2-methoxy-6-polyprenyl-1,4-benzoquinol methylase